MPKSRETQKGRAKSDLRSQTEEYGGNPQVNFSSEEEMPKPWWASSQTPRDKKKEWAAG